MLLRLLIVAQVAGIAAIGAAVRGALVPPAWRGPAESAAALAFYPVVLGFPLAVLLASRRAGLAGWERRILWGVEAALGLAALVAILPAVQ